jgi:hypothetical protein
MTMNKIRVSVLLAAVPALLLEPGSAGAANWQRLPLSQCIPAASSGATVTGVNLSDGGTAVTSGGTTITDTTSEGYAYCPFVQTSALPAGDVTSLSVDLYNPTSSSESNDSLFAATCTYSAWSESCSVGVLSPGIVANNHGTMSFSLSSPPVATDTLYYWYDNGSSGYAYIELEEEGGNPGNFVAGYYAEN